MEYIAFKLTGTKGFSESYNNLNLTSDKPYGIIPLLQITDSISKALNSKLLTQITISEYNQSLNNITQVDIEVQIYNIYPFYPVKADLVDKVNDSDLLNYQIISNNPESRFKAYPNSIILVKLFGNKYIYWLYIPENNAIAMINITDGTYYQYNGKWPNGTWELNT